jgi:LacI family transcriptional regulator
MRQKPNRKSITIQDVAKAAGVSVSTVSRVLNNKVDVSFETFEKVQLVIEELKYASSLAARGMRSHRTNVIGLVLPDVTSPYCIEIMHGVNQVIAESDYHLLIYTNGNFRKFQSDNQESQFVMLINGSIADGVIVVTPQSNNFSTTAPLVIIDPNHEEPDSPAIFSTNYEGALGVIKYLTGLGHRRIGYITGRLDLISSAQRFQGYKDGLAAAGIAFDETLIQIGDFTTETAAICTQKLLALSVRPSAIFASNDMSAMGVYQTAKQAGVCIPQDLSVIGFDNLREAAFLSPPLTTIDQSIKEMGVIATKSIIKLLSGETLENKLHILPTKLIIRESCRAMI